MSFCRSVAVEARTKPERRAPCALPPWFVTQRSRSLNKDAAFILIRKTSGTVAKDTVGGIYQVYDLTLISSLSLVFGGFFIVRGAAAGALCFMYDIERAVDPLTNMGNIYAVIIMLSCFARRLLLLPGDEVKNTVGGISPRAHS